MGYRYGGHRSQSEPGKNLQLGVSCMLYGTADSAQAAPGMQADSTRFKLIPLQGMMGPPTPSPSITNPYCSIPLFMSISG